MKWKTEKRKLKDLIEYENNPRILTDKAKSDIIKSLEKFDLVEIPAINTDNTIIAGHQRCKILMELEGPDFEIEVRVPDKKLNDKDFEEYNIRSNKNTGDWDWDILKNDFNKENLIEWGFEDLDFKSNENNYTKNIKAPIYKPNNKKPEITKLFNDEKTNKLIEEINNSNLKQDDKDFLIKSAYRHIIFNYNEIADYYANSDKEVQNLMEKSALVIIDFNKAIENGYIKLSDDIIKNYIEDEK